MEKIFNEAANKGGVYRIRNKINGIPYIGSTNRFKQRIAEHERALRNGKHSNPKLRNAFKKYKEEAFIFEVLEVIEGRSVKERRTIEQKYIDEAWPNCYNARKDTIKKQGPWSSTPEETRRKISLKAKEKIGKLNPFYGKTHTKETKKILSQMAEEKIGIKNPNYGNKWTKEMKEKMSKKAKKRCEDPKYIEKMSKAHKGRAHTKEEKQKLSDAVKNFYKNLSYKEKERRRKLAKRGAESPVARAINKIDKITNNILKRYSTIKEAALDNNLPNRGESCISACCSGRQKSAYGFRWEYAI